MSLRVKLRKLASSEASSGDTINLKRCRSPSQRSAKARPSALSPSIEEFTGRSIASDTVPFEITDMSPQCARRPHPAYDTRLDHGTAGAVVDKPCRGDASRTAAPEGPHSS